MNYLKRTFDLCVFLPNDIIIIEAKVAQSLDTSQMNEFRLDKKAIRVLHEKLDLPAVNVHLMGLVSDSYSPSLDTRKNFDAGIIT
jgi:hypothetical protein